MGAPAIATSLALGGLHGAISATQASSQNKAIRRSAESQQRAANAQAEQLDARTAVESGRLRRRAEQVAGRLRVAQADSGAKFSGSFENLAFQSDIGTGRNLAILDKNLAIQRSSLESGLDVRFSELGRMMQNPLIASILGGLQGVQTGLSLSAGVKELSTDTPERS